tara:strand:- start:5761 stop:6171 length:411 start_codon:yes stop_codon:yes gene_type:complete
MSAVAKYYKLTSKFLVDYNSEIATKLKDALELSDTQYDKLVETLKVDAELFDFRKMNKRGGSKGGATRAPTAYNLFVQQKIKELKLADPATDRKDLMIKAAAAWTEEKQKKAAAEQATTTTTEKVPTKIVKKVAKK